jgi:hypothetical protein
VAVALAVSRRFPTAEIPAQYNNKNDYEDCEMSKILQVLDNRLTDGGKVVSLTHRLRSTSQKYYFSGYVTHLC